MWKLIAFVATILAAVPLAIAWVISQHVVHPRRRVEDHDLQDFGLPAEELAFRSRDGTWLAGWFIPPARGGTPAAGVVLSHGWARSRAELLPHADFLHRAGFAVLAFDYRHRGKSGGTKVTMGLRERGDLLGAIDTLAGRREVDASRLACFGMSMGGVVALLVGAEDQRLRAFVVEAPFADQDTIRTRSLRHYYHLPSFPLSHLAKLFIERRIGGSLDEVRPMRAVGEISPRPLFVIADEADTLVGPQDSERIFEAAGEPKRFWLVPGAEHARGWQAAPAAYERRVLAFLEDALATRAERAGAAAAREAGA